MKKIIALSTAVFLSVVSFAQNDSTMSKKNKTTDSKTIYRSESDGVTMKNGTMMTIKKGQMTTMTTDHVCKDGTRISSKGLVSKKDGSEIMLKEGEYIDSYGKVIPVNNSKTNKDKNMYLVPDSTLQKNK